MILIKSSILLFALLAISANTFAEQQSISVMESSTSGRLVRLNIGTSPGLIPGSPVLFSSNGKKIAAGRVVRVDHDSSIIALLEHYNGQKRLAAEDYDFLFGEPFDEADNLPDYIADREEEEDNPSNEKFFTPEGKELDGPELDDDDYTPEITLRPKMPLPRTFSTHNLTVGVGLFRNRALVSQETVNASSRTPFTTYQGYSARYAYTFRTHYWVRQRAAALLSAELSFGIYNFSHTFPTTTSSAAHTADIRVIPLGFNLRYLVEVNKLFRLYPYIGYQNNIVSATNSNFNGIQPLKGGRLLGGAGAQLVMSEAIDTRFEGGSDGLLFGLVVKF